MQHPRQVMTRDLLYDRIWGYDFGGESNIIEVYIRYLRSKLEGRRAPADPDRARGRLRAAGRISMSIRTRLTLWYTGLLARLAGRAGCAALFGRGGHPAVNARRPADQPGARRRLVDPAENDPMSVMASGRASCHPSMSLLAVLHPDPATRRSRGSALGESARPATALPADVPQNLAVGQARYHRPARSRRPAARDQRADLADRSTRSASCKWRPAWRPATTPAVIRRVLALRQRAGTGAGRGGR